MSYKRKGLRRPVKHRRRKPNAVAAARRNARGTGDVVLRPSSEAEAAALAELFGLEGRVVQVSWSDNLID